MTSLASAFGEGAPEPASGRTAQHAAYSNPVAPSYVDNSGADEGDKRFSYEMARQKLYARSPPQHSHQRPTMASQESFQVQRPGEYEAPQGPLEAGMSCGTCRAGMQCSADGVFCAGCNRQTLDPRPAPISSLFK